MDNAATDWFHDAQYGIFVHYLYASQKDFASFDAAAFAAAVHETGAKYLFMTLGQNSGWFCSPNETYENFIGAVPGTWCSRRDIPMEAAAALAQYGIRLMLYLPSQGPSAAGDGIPRALGATERHDETNWYIKKTYAQRWSKVIREWSLRYGELVAGWWFDGFYENTGYAGETAEYVSVLYKDACRAGNPNSIVAFNQGVMNGLIQPATAVCDYTAGEENTFEALPPARFYAGAQWHILSYLGSWWGAPDLKYDSGYLAQYALGVIRAGGVVTFEIHINTDGSFAREQLDELALVKQAVYP
ncbi:MAG TPA: alpha-L-fucosidase [Clostridiales bacterium]|nr:MAG: Alpha-L-fucosidase [Firmicutes bacterium ADurb.Bin262]HOU09978.1 alpha-L-fucosidase [Clostridiales bacterium]HQH64152.1 alpha-L-fucosidase [Clostridiales bacterium]HQK72492.1 alpha-L-fucosidase [Clostridiales bacterium]